jgi:hypothetical protein
MELEIPHGLAEAPMENQHRVAAALWVHHWTRQDKSRPEMIQRLAVVRQHHYPGYRWLINNHNEAASIKVRLKWHDPDDEQTDWQDEPSVLASVRQVQELAKESVPVAAACLTALRSAIGRYAPQFLHLLPESVIPAKPKESDIGLAAKSTVPPPPPITAAAPKPPPPPPDPLAAFEAKHGRPAGSLTPEQLQAAREANPGSKGLAQPAETPKPAQPPSEADSGACPKQERWPPRHMPWDTP